MTDAKLGEEEKVEAPTEDNPEPESAKEEADQPQPEEQESPEAETGKNAEGDKPKDNAAWAAMRKENKRLKEELEGIDPEYLERLRGATSPQEFQSQESPDLTEDADYSEVTKRVNWAQDQATRARQENAQLRAQLELQQDRQAEESYPELKTDKQFQQIVAEKKLAARVLGHGRTTTEIAREVKNLLSRRDEQVAAQTAESTKQQMNERQAATAEARGQTSGGVSTSTNEELRQRVRKGDMEAQNEVAKGLIADLEIT